MYYDPAQASALVDMKHIHMGRDHVLDLAADRLFRVLAQHAEEELVPDFRAEDCDIHTHVFEATGQLEVTMVWNPQPGHIELLGGPQDGSAWQMADPSMDHVRVFPPRSKRHHPLEPVPPMPEPVIYSRWKINGSTRRWVFRYSS